MGQVSMEGLNVSAPGPLQRHLGASAPPAPPSAFPNHRTVVLQTSKASGKASQGRDQARGAGDALHADTLDSKYQLSLNSCVTFSESSNLSESRILCLSNLLSLISRIFFDPPHYYLLPLPGSHPSPPDSPQCHPSTS